MQIKQREVYTSRYFRRGGSYMILIPPDIRELMHFLPGDSILMNCDEGVLWIVRAQKTMVIDRKKMTAIFDRLYAEKREDNGKHV
jgi:antitoxin component of MazEF toxin-antitoxin module